jgi:murein DD-endopeptidase MepM/ murein hydrolase activator NlpD
VSRAVGVVAVVVVGALLILAVPFLWLATEAPARPVCGFIDGGIIVTVPDSYIPDGRLTAEQSFYASVVVSEVVRRGLSVRAAEIAMATVITETKLSNPTEEESDGDSAGLFQQLPTSYATINRRDPVQATNAFLDDLLEIPDWETRPPGEVAQAVQRSAFPDRYADHLASAAGIVTALWSKAGTLPACARGEVLAGNYTLPVAKEIFAANPDYLTKPHHSYPAADIPLTAGTPVYAVVGGRVIASPVGGDCGDGVGIQGDDGVEYIYCHGEVAIAPVGAHVTVGELIMRSGWSGHVEPPGPAGAHLHLQLRVPGIGLVCPQPALVAWSQGQAVNPFTLPASGCTN